MYLTHDGDEFCLHMDWRTLLRVFGTACRAGDVALIHAIEDGVARPAGAKPRRRDEDMPLVLTGPGGDYRRGWTPAAGSREQQDVEVVSASPAP